jgi:hypothetical protein
MQIELLRPPGSSAAGFFMGNRMGKGLSLEQIGEEVARAYHAPAEVLSWPSNVCPEGWEIVERNPGPTFMGMTIVSKECLARLHAFEANVQEHYELLK